MPLSQPSSGPSLLVVELGLTLVTVALAICFPRLGCGWFSRLETALRKLARRRTLCIFLCGATACILRLLLLPLSPIPQPYIHDDFSFLLAADTFAHGRLTNPTPIMWTHFESFHIDMTPSYMSMYFPLQGMVMAAGKVLVGHPWYGILASCSLMCAAICWMLQGWLPPGWALLGAMLVVLRLALFSYWIDTYTGAGALAALGGALVAGALPRIWHHFRTRDFFWMALGMAILATSRPYEGLLVGAPAVAFLAWAWFKKPHPPMAILLRRTVPAVALLAATFAFMGYYDYRVFGNVLTSPYKLNRQAYAVAQHFLWQRPLPEPAYRHRIMRDFYAGSVSGSEMKYFREETRSAHDILAETGIKLFAAAVFYLGFALVPPLVMLPWALRDGRMVMLTVTAAFVAVGVGVETFFLQHYLASATVLIYAMLLQCMRHIRVRGASGLFLVRALPILCIALASIRVCSERLHIGLPPASQWYQAWYGTERGGRERASVLAQLERLPGRQLAIVAYAPKHMADDWVYNAADIEESKVIWARQMDPASDRELLKYYGNRQAWLVEPDSNPPRVSRFSTAPSTPAECANIARVGIKRNRKSVGE